jgi:hypothetical protein
MTKEEYFQVEFEACVGHLTTSEMTAYQDLINDIEAFEQAGRLTRFEPAAYSKKLFDANMQSLTTYILTNR